MTKRIAILSMLTAVFALAGKSAQALTTFNLTGISITANSTEPGLVINTQALVPPTVTFGLEDGDSATFDLFKIWTNETTVNSGEDTVAKPISVTLTFSSPPTGGSSGTVGGSTVGVSTLFGVIQYGKVTWSGVAVVDHTEGEYQIALSDETFNLGLFGLDPGLCDGATVKATVTQIFSIAPGPPVDSVPEPASLGMAVTALGVFGLMGLRRLRRRPEVTSAA